MLFGFLGINYKNADLNVRDKTSFTDIKKVEFLQQADKISVEQCMILSTCNRSEIYFFYEKEAQFERMKLIYENTFKEVDVTEYLVSLKGKEAIKYLFKVASGLESLVLGEDQILGQVKDAIDFARTMGYAKKELNKVVRDAITCAKHIKMELKISERPVSVSYIGIRKIEEYCSFSQKTVCVIGSGKTAVLALKYIYDYGAKRVILVNRTIENAVLVKEKYPLVEITSFERRYEAIAESDIVVSATSSPHLVVKREHLLSDQPKVFLDLAAPRDIEAKVMEITGSYLVNIDTLQQIASENLKERERLVKESEAIITEELKETLSWLLISRMDSTIESLQLRCSRIVDDSFEYLNHKIEFNSREQKILKKVLNASLQRLLKEPIQELKQLDTKEKQEEYKKIVNHLFQI